MSSAASRLTPMSRRALVAVAIAVGIASLGVVPAAHTSPPAACAASAAKGKPGVSPGAGIGTLSDADLARELDAMRAAGVHSVRVDVDWSAIEPQRGTRTWTALDRVVGAVTSRGMCTVGVVAYTPLWAASASDRPTDSHFRPADPNLFAAFAKDAAIRYRDTIGIWEIWNEPNLTPFYKPAPDIAGYGELLAATSAALRTLSPAPTVLSGGLAPAVDNGRDIAPLTFLTGIYRAGLKNSFDAVAVHPYTFPALPNDPSTRSYSTFQRMWDMHDMMAANGDGAKQIWMTEAGAPTGTNPVAVSESVQAQTVRIILQASRDTVWLGPGFIYNTRDTGTNTGDIEQNFGLLRRDFSPKAAYAVVGQFGATTTPVTTAPAGTTPVSTPVTTPVTTPPVTTPPITTPPVTTSPVTTPPVTTPPVTTVPAAPMYGSS